MNSLPLSLRVLIQIAVALLVRMAPEDRTLQEKLPGYRGFVERIRYRPIPGDLVGVAACTFQQRRSLSNTSSQARRPHVFPGQPPLSHPEEPQATRALLRTVRGWRGSHRNG